MEEEKLTKKQRKWLDASRKIGLGAMTKTERQTLEKLYADMLPREQQELTEHIRANFGLEESKEGQEEEPSERMARRNWNPPSAALRSALSKTQRLKPPIDKP